MESEGRIRISLTTGELEIEGSSEFVKAYDESIAEMLQRLVAQPVSRPAPGSSTSDAGGVPDTSEESNSEVGVQGAHPDLALGEALHKLPKAASGADKLLVAALYAQREDPANEFTTASAHKLLIDQGTKLSNAAQAVKGSVEAKRVFKVRGNKWRISQAGMDHLAGYGVV